MTTVEISIKLTVDDLVAAVAKLPDKERAEFMERIAAWQTEPAQAASLSPEKELWSAAAAQQAADQAVCGDLEDCPLRSDPPMFVPNNPKTHWRVPYRSSDGAVLGIVAVDAYTGHVDLPPERRAALLEQAERVAAKNG